MKFDKLQTEAANLLGFFPEEVAINNGVAEIPITYMSKVSQSSLTAVENALKANGATSIRVNSGPIINTTITERLNNVVKAGKDFLGFKVTKTADKNNMFILEKSL